MTKRIKKTVAIVPVDNYIVDMSAAATFEPPAIKSDFEHYVAGTEPTPVPLAELPEFTAAEINAVLRSIDPESEVAATAGVLDHATQFRSWTSEAKAQDDIVQQAIDKLDEEEAPADLDVLIEAVEKTQANVFVTKIAASLDERADFETTKNADNLNIQRSIAKARKMLVTLRAAKMLIAVNCDTTFLNRSVHDGSRYNVYAYGKLGDIVYGVTGGQIANAINIAVMKSLFAFNKAGATFDLECAKGAASKQYSLKIAASLRKLLICHTVSTSTAPTQASSTMQALVTLGVVKSNGSGKNPVYAVLDTPLTRKLQAALAA